MNCITGLIQWNYVHMNKVVVEVSYSINYWGRRKKSISFVRSVWSTQCFLQSFNACWIILWCAVKFLNVWRLLVTQTVDILRSTDSDQYIFPEKEAKRVNGFYLLIKQARCYILAFLEHDWFVLEHKGHFHKHADSFKLRSTYLYIYGPK